MENSAHTVPSRPVVLLGLTLLACAGGGEPAPASGPTATLERPNWIVIAPDTLRADRLGLREEGELLAPRMTALAEEGALFEQAFAQGGWTAPALAATLTGRYPPALDAHPRHADFLPSGAYTLPEILAVYGYTTAVFWRDTAAGLFGSFSRGFGDVVRASPEPRPLGQPPLEWLRAGPTEPFFLLVHEVDLQPEEVPPEHAWREDRSNVLDSVQAGLDSYDRAVRSYDAVVGALLDELKASGLDERTVVVLTSNHGEDLAEHFPSPYHGFLYDSCLRVPLVIRDPAQDGPRRIDTVVQAIDLAPTVLERSGIPVERRMDGHSLLPLLGRGEGSYTERVVYSLTNAENASLRTRDHKLVMCGGKKPVCRDMQPSPVGVTAPGRLGSSGAELYDLATDPGEQRNLIVEQPTLYAEHRAALEAWLQAQQPHPRPPGSSGDDALKRALQERGYWELAAPAEEPSPAP
jgi:arylsulfatase A-like enzyme